MKAFRMLVRTILLGILAILLSVSATFVSASPAAIRRMTYLPLINKNAYYGISIKDKFIGINMPQYWQDSAVATYMPVADNLAGKKHSVTAWAINLQDVAFATQIYNTSNNFYRQMEALWKSGYISFVNISSAASKDGDWLVSNNCPIPANMYQIAKGDCDNAIRKMADLYLQWINSGTGKKAFIALFPEMNGVMDDGTPWTVYGGDAGNLKIGYQRIISIFAQRGVSQDKAWWVFAPNGWSPAAHKFENYYPGDSLVDIVAFSSYNFGYCGFAWENYDKVFRPYIDRMNAMAPFKPIIIAQTGSSAQYQSASDYNVSAKNTWLQENYQSLANQPQVLGTIYFDYAAQCDWRITGDTTTFKPGYQAGAAPYKYLNSQQLNSIIP